MDSAPRLFGILAPCADLIAILRRGPSDWCQVGLWDTAARRYQAGSWFRGTIFPQRCDLSPDGRWLCYAAFKGNNRGPLGDSYIAISRAPWLHALAAWSLEGTWSRGYHFVSDPGTWDPPAPGQGSVEAIRARFGLALSRPVQFATERRRGWIEPPDSPPRAADDTWDERRNARIQKRQPRTRKPLLLAVEGRYAAFREGQHRIDDLDDLRYTLSDGATTRILEDAQWADWSHRGELLLATRQGTLQQIVCHGLDRHEVRVEADLTGYAPDPQPPPPEALQW